MPNDSHGGSEFQKFLDGLAPLSLWNERREVHTAGVCSGTASSDLDCTCGPKINFAKFKPENGDARQAFSSVVTMILADEEGHKVC